MTRGRACTWAPVASCLLVLLSAACTTNGSTAASGPAGTTAPSGNGASTPAASGAAASPRHPHRFPATQQVAARRLPWHLPSPVAREAAIATAAGVVVAGGLVAGDQSTAATYRLDLATGSSTGLGALPVPVHDVGGVTVHGEPVVVGGGNATEQDTVQRWQRGTGWQVTGALPTARSDLSTVRVGGRIYAIGGYDATSPALGAVLSSATGGRTWTPSATLRVPVRYAAVAVAGRAIWIFGGERSGQVVDPVQRLSLRTGTVRVVTHLPQPLGDAVAVSDGSRILLVGGRTDSGSETDALWWFSPGSGRFTRAGSLPTPLANSAAVVVDRRAYLIGGETPSLSDRVIAIRLP